MPFSEISRQLLWGGMIKIIFFLSLFFLAIDDEHNKFKVDSLATKSNVVAQFFLTRRAHSALLIICYCVYAQRMKNKSKHSINLYEEWYSFHYLSIRSEAIILILQLIFEKMDFFFELWFVINQSHM